MDTILKNASISAFYEDLWNQRDIRLDEYYAMNSPLFVLMLCCFYVLFSLYFGPWMMKNKKPYNIKPFVIIFNIIMVASNAYIFKQGWSHGWSNYKLVCEPVDTSNNPDALMCIKVLYAFYLTKFLDWFDTIFIVLRKKFTHLTFLHLYHHGIMPINIWIVARFLPGGHVTFGLMLNTLVHTVMYAYYALSALGPQFQKYLWWKRYITVMQLLQFVVGMFHMCLIPFCDYDFPLVILYYYIPQGIIFIALFTNFYIKTYKKRQSVGISVSKTHAE